MNEGTTARWLAAAFAVYGLLAIAFLAIIVPPFQSPDEVSHFMRAAQVAEGTLIGSRTSTTDAGGPTDPAILLAFIPFDPLRFHPETRATSAMWAPRLHWSARRWPASFPNTAIDPPVFYVPAAIGVLVGRATRMTVVQTLVLSRLLTGTAAVAIGAAAIAIAGGASVWLFAVLTLPMSLAVMATPSQDALMLACSALAGALLVRLLRWPDDRNGKVLVWLVVMLVLVATARIPNATLALLLLGLIGVPLRSRLLALTAVAVCVLAWFGLASAVAMVNFDAQFGADPTAQTAWLLAHPLRLAPILWNTFTKYWPDYVEWFVGKLGWLDTALPRLYHTAAQAMLGVAAVAAMLGLRGARIGVANHLVIAAGVLLAVVGMVAAQYVSSTAVGHDTVEGPQGRHFLPIVLAGAAVLPALGATRLARLHNPLVLLVAVFPVVTLAVVMRAVVLRYYLG